MGQDESALPIMSVVRYTHPDYDEVFISLRDGQAWSGSHEGHSMWHIPGADGSGPDIDVVTDDEDRVVAIILRNAEEAHPSLLAIAEQRLAD